MTRLASVRMGRQLPAGLSGVATPSTPLADAHAEARAAGHAEGLARGLREGRAQGLAQGLEEGRAQALGEAREQAARVAQAEAASRREAQARWLAAVDRLQAVAGAVRESCAQELVLLCSELLARLLGDALAEPAAVQARLARLLAELPACDPVTIRVHPQWLATGPDSQAPVSSQWPLERMLHARTQLRFLPDPALGVADIVLDLPQGSLDARLDRVWEQVRVAVGEAATSAPAASSLAPGARA